MARDWLLTRVNCGVVLTEMLLSPPKGARNGWGAYPALTGWASICRRYAAMVGGWRLCGIGTSCVPGQECTSPHQGDKFNPQLQIAVKPRLPIRMLRWSVSIHPQVGCCLTELCRFLVKPHARRNGCPSDAVRLAPVYLAGEPFFGFIISHSFSDSILPRAVNSPAPWSHSPPSMVIVSPLM
jgi:hypothetical protein